MAKPLRKSTPCDTETLKAGESVLLEPAKRLCQYCARLAEQQGKAVRLLKTLLSYGVAPGPDLPREALEVGRDELAKHESPEMAEKAFLAAGEHPKGRPVVRRHVAAKALEAKLANPRLKRRELAQKFCPCGKKNHTEECAERLRRDMQRLNVLIRQILRDYPA